MDHTQGIDLEAHEPKRPEKPRRGFWTRGRLFLALGAAALAGLVTLVLIVFLGCPPVEHLKGQNPRTTSLIEARKRQGRISREFPPLTSSWVKLEQIPEKLQKTFIVAEDCSFYRHSGIDWYEVGQASRQTYERGRIVRGASTISQQLAKNLFLSEDRSMLRKLREFIIVGRLERELSKQRILELYLNCIEYGQGVFGIGMASSRFFGRTPAGLSLSQMVRLAAVLPAPRRMNPNRPSEELERRARMILGRLLKFDYITEQEFQEAEGSLNAFFGST